MKLLIAAFTFPPNKDGVSEASAVMAQGFLDAGWKVDIATMPTSPARESMVWNGASIHEFQVAGNGHPKRPFYGEVDKYRKFLASGEWDVIIFHSYEWMLRLALHDIESISGKKILVSHGHAGCQWVKFPRFPWGLGVWMLNLWDAVRMMFWIRKLDHVTFLSATRNLHEFLDHLLVSLSGYRKFSIIPNGIAPVANKPDKAQFRLRHGIPKDATFFLSVANYSRRKDQGYAARSFRQANIPESRLVFIGSLFNEMSELFQKNDTASDGAILWLENQTREETLLAIAECDVFVLSSDHEGLPIAILEAMRETKPWIARRSGCVESIPGGMVVTSEREMASAMRRLAVDAQARDELAAAGHAAIRSTYNVQAYVDAYIGLVSSLMKEGKQTFA